MVMNTSDPTALPPLPCSPHRLQSECPKSCTSFNTRPHFILPEMTLSGVASGTNRKKNFFCLFLHQAQRASTPPVTAGPTCPEELIHKKYNIPRGCIQPKFPRWDSSGPKILKGWKQTGAGAESLCSIQIEESLFTEK